MVQYHSRSSLAPTIVPCVSKFVPFDKFVILEDVSASLINIVRISRFLRASKFQRVNDFVIVESASDTPDNIARISCSIRVSKFQSVNDFLIRESASIASITAVRVSRFFYKIPANKVIDQC